jgi:hypothetical protein
MSKTIRPYFGRVYLREHFVILLLFLLLRLHLDAVGRPLHLPAGGGQVCPLGWTGFRQVVFFWSEEGPLPSDQKINSHVVIFFCPMWKEIGRYCRTLSLVTVWTCQHTGFQCCGSGMIFFGSGSYFWVGFRSRSGSCFGSFMNFF